MHTFHLLCLHTPQTLCILPLTNYMCHFAQLPTASPSHSGSLSLLSHPDKTSSTLSSRKRNLSYGSTKKQSTAKIRFLPPCLSLNHKLLRNVKAPASEMLFWMKRWRFEFKAPAKVASTLPFISEVAVQFWSISPSFCNFQFGAPELHSF